MTARSAAIPKVDASFIDCNNESEWSRVFVGMHALLRQAPPILFFSTNMTDAPSLDARSAALYPAGPPPMIVISPVKSGINKVTFESFRYIF